MAEDVGHPTQDDDGPAEAEPSNKSVVREHSVQEQYWLTAIVCQVTGGDYLCVFSSYEVLHHKRGEWTWRDSNPYLRPAPKSDP